jgi:proline iminopeptidase
MAHRLRAVVAVLTVGAFCLLGGRAGGQGSEAGKTFKAPGATIYYEVRGGGPGTPLVIANGGPGFDHLYLHSSPAWDKLAERRPVVFYDQRGNGRSGALAAGQSCTLADQIDDLEALRAHLGYERMDLLGHSWGGYLAMAYAARHPERIDHLVICDSAAPKWSDTVFLFNDIFPEGIERQNALEFASQLGDKAASQASIREYLAMLFYSPEKRDRFLAAADSYVYNKEVNERVNADLARFDLGPELPKFHFPTLVITGRYDINAAPVGAWRIHKAIPGSRFAVFERSGHMPFYEEPEEFVRLLDGFLAGR